MLGKYEEYERVKSISYVVTEQQKPGGQLITALEKKMLSTSFVSLPVTFLGFIIYH